MSRKWKPSKSAKDEFKKQMQEIEEFITEHNISASLSRDSYYFAIDGISYRVSNHSIEASNRHAFNEFGEQIREKYHEDTRCKDVVYIHASKTRIRQIFNDLQAGYRLDGRGNRKDS